MNETDSGLTQFEDGQVTSRRTVLMGAISTAAAFAAMPSKSNEAGAAVRTGLVDFQNTDTAIVLIDPQNDVLSEKGAN